MVDIEHDHRQIPTAALHPGHFGGQAFLEITPVVDTGQRIGDRQRPQLLLHPLHIGNVRDVAMPQHAATRQFLRRGLATYPTQTPLRQLHAVFLAPGAEGVGRGADRGADTGGVLGVNPGEDRFGIEQQHIRFQLVDIANAVAGIDHAEASVEFHLELVDAAGHVGAELLQQQVPRRERFMDPFAFGDVDAHRQVPDPQALLVEHRRGEHVDHQMAAIAAHQRPLPRLVAALHVAFDQHRLASRHWFAKAAAQLCRASDQFPGQVQVLQGHMADHFGTGIAKHLLGTGVEGADDAAQVGGDDRDLGGGIQHATQLTMGAAQLLLSIP
ncbi:hypothetical protein D3C87_1142760 [compost metagenome]